MSVRTYSGIAVQEYQFNRIYLIKAINAATLTCRSKVPCPTVNPRAPVPGTASELNHTTSNLRSSSRASDALALPTLSAPPPDDATADLVANNGIAANRYRGCKHLPAVHVSALQC